MTTDAAYEIETMLTFKEVCDILQWSRRTMNRRLKEPIWCARLGAKRDGGQWRFVRRHVHAYATSLAC